jgi:hypothetical protein
MSKGVLYASGEEMNLMARENIMTQELGGRSNLDGTYQGQLALIFCPLLGHILMRTTYLNMSCHLREYANLLGQHLRLL